MTAPSKPVRVGLQLQPQHADYKTTCRTASEAEELGADVVFNWDHFYPLYGEASDGKHFGGALDDARRLGRSQLAR